VYAADVVIGAIHTSKGRTPMVVTEDMVSNMKFGSVIVDVSIDQGGCFETSQVTNHDRPVFQSHGVTHYCVPNIAARVSRTASYALSNIFASDLIQMGDEGGISNIIRAHAGWQAGVYMYHGTLTNETIGSQFDLPWKPLELLIATGY
jgi:alanine dehydrogenase